MQSTSKSPDVREIFLQSRDLAGRTFLLGNKRAFSLALPASAGRSPALLHPHKWFGAYGYGRKYLEGQIVRAVTERQQVLSSRNQTGLSVGLTSARREYDVDGRVCSETYFVPDGIQGFACKIDGDATFLIEPEFDLRFTFALGLNTDAYEVESIPDGAIVSHRLQSARYDDRAETLQADDTGAQITLFAAVQIAGEEAQAELLPIIQRSHRKLFRKDQQRHRFLAHSASEGDHAPLWDQSSSRVYAPVRLRARGCGTVAYGFGGTREEAMRQVTDVRQHLARLESEKEERAHATLCDARFTTGSAAVDDAYAHVLMRFVDGLVARRAMPQDTALNGPATMILAGNQYFYDSWTRDENIALGSLLSLGFYETAREVVADTWQLQDPATGRLPQRIRAGEEPTYHSSDGTLWALLRLHQYRSYTGDDSLLGEKLPMVELFFSKSLDRSLDGMLPSGRVSTSDYLWETWMDTPHTPRDGFPVEIQMLWIACLRRYRPIVAVGNPDLEARMAEAESAAWRALDRFYVNGMPTDGLDESGQARDMITPNPYFCFGLGLDLHPDTEAIMRDIGRRQLAGRQGIRTLAPQDWGKVLGPAFLADRRHVRGRQMRSIGKFNYHRGVEWNWLAQFFVRAELKSGDPEVAFHKYLRNQVTAALRHGGIGGISELFDLSGTRGPEFQAWSMAGFLEALHAFAGVEIDVPSRHISISPQIPAAWPRLSVRKWYGDVPFDLEYATEGLHASLQVAFPRGEPQDVDLEISLIVPANRLVHALDLRVDDRWHVPVYRTESIASSRRKRLKLSVPAAPEIELLLELESASSRARSAA
jgi:Amylo-alpha-1,6-glucosidase